MDFDKKLLDELLVKLSQSDGGIVLETDSQPAAVVLSVSKYAELNAGSPTATPMPAVLVLGGAGYIGGHVVRLLLEEGLLPVVVDNLSTGRREHIIEPAVFVRGDIANSELIIHLANQYNFVCAIHLAASLEVGESVEKPVEYAENNLINTFHLLKALDIAGVKRVIFSSTAAVYGQSDTQPISESTQTNPTNPYGESKLLTEGLLEYFTRYRGFQITVFRYFNVAGIVPEWNIGDTHPENHLFPAIYKASVTAQRFVLNGDDWPTRDGSTLRDYLHVLDIARAHVTVLRATPPSGLVTYNLGTGHGSTVKEVIGMVAEVGGKMVALEVGPRRPGDVPTLVADGTKIERELGFTLKHSKLEDIILSIWKPSEFSRS